MTNFSVDQLKATISASGGLARSNMYAVQLPPIYKSDGTGESAFNRELIMPAQELNVLCKGTQLPGRQVTTIDRQIGMQTAKIAYGYQVSDLTLTFVVMNDYKIRKYFDAWQRLAVDYANGEVGYASEYALDVTVSQLRKGWSAAVSEIDVASDFVQKIPSSVRNRLPDIPILGDVLRTGTIGIDLGTDDKVMYQVKLVGAFPTSIQAVDFVSEQDGMVELSVQLSFTNWHDVAEINEGEEKSGGITSFFTGWLDKFSVF